LLEQDRPSVLRQAIQAVRKGGTVSVPGVYGGLLDKVPFGAVFGKGVTMKMGQTNMHNYMKPLLALIEEGQVDHSRFALCGPQEIKIVPIEIGQVL
jgi:threonine dehydrogenase-like Zn-dependent dehydrogenase